MLSALINAALKRPVAVTAFYVLVVVLAAVAYVRLPVALLPSLQYPSLVVWTTYPDVPPDRVERLVTQRVEQAVAGTSGLVRMTSRSQLGGSLVRLDFGWNANLDLAMLEVREQLDRMGAALPDEAERPAVLRIDPSDRPIMVLALGHAGPLATHASSGAGPQAAPGVPPQTSDAPPPLAQNGFPPRAREDLQDLVGLKQVGQEIVARRLEQIDGVARVRVTGGHEREIRIVVDPDRLATFGLGLEDVSRALQVSNVALSGGMIRRGPFRYAVEVSGEFTSVRDVAETVIGGTGAGTIRVRDVASVREDVAERRGFARLDGSETLLLLLERRVDANTVRTAAAVRGVLDELGAEMPGVGLTVVVDESRFIRAAIDGVVQAVLLGGLLAIAVLFVFLRRPVALAAVSVAVPLSMAMTLVLFDLLDVSLNLISLSGLALGIGMLVDNAIVVTENIARLREKGAAAFEAARDGTREVAAAVTASTLTTISVFLPLTFVEGLAGRLFRDQSLAVVCSLLASLVVALTVVPVIASRERSAVKGGLPRRLLLWHYERGLGWCLDHRALVLAGAAVLLVLAGWIGSGLPRQVIPQADQGRVEMNLTLGTDADLSLVSDRSALLEAQLLRRPDVRHVLADLGERDEARLDLDPRPPYEADLTLILSESGSMREVMADLSRLPASGGVVVQVKPVRTQLEQMLVPDDADLFIDLISERRLDAERLVPEVLEALRARPELANVRRADENEVPAYRLTFRREEMARFGVSSATMATYLEAAARGRRATELRGINEEIPVVLRAREVDSIERLMQERIPTAGGMLPLGTFVQAELVQLPASLIRTNQASVARLTADVAPGSDLAAAGRAIQTTFEAVLPPAVRGTVGGANEAFMNSLRAVAMSLLLSVLLVFLILAAQFESLRQPFIILSAVPLAAAGVVLVLFATGQTVNLMSLTGCVVLVGIVVNDAIIKVDFINQRRRAGMAFREAILQAGRDRVRPILMTTITTVVGLLPLALGLGDGAELRAPLAIALIGGLISATVLTLFVVPVIYAVIVPRDQLIVPRDQ